MKKILLADDDTGIRECLGKLLASEHYQVVYANTGQSAAETFMGEQPDLVLFDLAMPNRDGCDLFELMDRTRPWVPVIIITANPNRFKYARELGVDALMEKPLNLPLLLETIRDFLVKSDMEYAWQLTRVPPRDGQLDSTASSAILTHQRSEKSQ